MISIETILHTTCAYRLLVVSNTATITSLTDNSYNLPIRGYFDIFKLQAGWDNSFESSNLKILSVTPTSYNDYMLKFNIDNKWKDLIKMYFDIE